MRWFVALVLLVHGLIHLLGFTKAFELYEAPELTGAVSRPAGVMWLLAAVLMGVSAVTLAAQVRGWWALAAIAVVLSQAAIATSWSDAKFGSLANIIVALAALYGAASEGPWSFAASYRESVAARADVSPGALITDADLQTLPAPLQRFLRRSGVVGTPRVRSFAAVWRGRIRSGPNDPLMDFTAVQHSFVEEPSRFFHLRATRAGLPVDVYHAFEGGSASMQVRLLSLAPLVHATGPEMDRAETVTLFNDLVLLAPSALIDAPIRWEPVDPLDVPGASAIRAHYTAGANTIAAVLHFDEEGRLVDFVSDDRLAANDDGTRFERMRWSTPVLTRGTFAGVEVLTRGEGRWHPEAGAYTYLEIELVDLSVNPRAAGHAAR